MICGWKLLHNEKFVYRANAGKPDIELKFYHYPEYRQRVRTERAPENCRLKKKGENAFFLFRNKLPIKGTISLDREVSVFPEERMISLDAEWGRISEFPEKLRMKYRESSRYWPVKSNSIDAPRQDWFQSDELSFWTRSAWKYIRGKIRPKNQERRLGAEQAIEKGTGDCDELTDLFMTLARMRGIPCRRITGFFIADEGRHAERHAWAEILTQKFGWVTVDIALNNIGAHTINYVVLKVEEFNPAISDYQVRINQHVWLQCRL